MNIEDGNKTLIPFTSRVINFLQDWNPRMYDEVYKKERGYQQRQYLFLSQMPMRIAFENYGVAVRNLDRWKYYTRSDIKEL